MLEEKKYLSQQNQDIYSMKNYKLSTVTWKKNLCLSTLLDEIVTKVLIKKTPN